MIKIKTKLCFTLILSIFLITNITAVGAEEKSTNFGPKACLNLGNALDAPNEGDWGYTIKEKHIQAIADAGFEMVRIPVRWSRHTSAKSPYLIDPKLIERVDDVIRQSLDRDLIVILDVHHFDQLYQHPEILEVFFLSIWNQLSTHYANWPDNLYFELLNEPRGNLQGEKYQSLLENTLATVRVSNPVRKVIIGGAPWNSLDALEKMHWPQNDENLIATFHYYEPHSFTHQGAPWENPVRPTGVKWGSDDDRKTVAIDFDRAKAIGEKLGVPVILGEFGAYKPKISRKQRLNYYEAIRAEADRTNIAWCAWNFASDFSIYDTAKNKWHKDMLKVLGLIKQ